MTIIVADMYWMLHAREGSKSNTFVCVVLFNHHSNSRNTPILLLILVLLLLFPFTDKIY